MLMRLFFGIMIILCFLVIYPYFITLWTDNTTGFLTMMSGITTSNGSSAMSDMETSIWGLFPLFFLVMGIGGYVWLIAKDR